jgi:saccharopine dehydrogenase-like NADP-dependent oxidoreductase
MFEIKTLAIIGASGNVGEGVLPSLLQKTNLQITVISRPESKATFPAAVNVVRASADDPASFEKAFQGQDAVLSLVPSFGASNESLIVDAAAKAGVKYFVPSQFGHDTTDPKVVELLPLFIDKVRVVEKLRSHESTMGWAGIVTGMFLDWVSSFGCREECSEGWLIDGKCRA